MAKNLIPMIYEIVPSRQKRSPWRIGTFCVLAVIIVPIVIEGSLLCYGQWSSVMGRSTRVSTPIIDTVSGALHDAKDLIADVVSPSIARVFREPAVAVPVALVLIVCGMALLKR